jgi:hypothetical protein
VFYLHHDKPKSSKKQTKQSNIAFAGNSHGLPHCKQLAITEKENIAFILRLDTANQISSLLNKYKRSY